MLINRVATHLLTAPELQDTMRTLADGDDASLSVAQSARTLLSAAIWAHDPRPTLLVVPGEENADRMANALSAWLGHASVCRFPERKDWPWSDKAADDAVIGARCHALDLLAKGENCLVVASARSLLRRVPPKGSGFYEGATFEVGEEVEFEDMGRLLVSMGYADTGEVDAPGTFHIHGDLVDIYPAQATSAVRIEFFGDEIDRIRRMVPATGQTIQDLDSVSIVPAREIAFTDETIAKATISLMHSLADDKNVEADLELIKERAQAPHLDKYLPDLYGGKTSTPIEHLSKDTLVVLMEPRSLFDDCLHATDDINRAAQVAKTDPKDLFTAPKDLDFGKQQRLTFSSIERAGARSPMSSVQLKVQQPHVSGSDTRLIGRLRQLVRDRFAIVFCVAERSARETLQLRLSDESIPFCEELSVDEDKRGGTLQNGLVTFVDAPVPSGVIIPTSHLAVITVYDLNSRITKKKRPRRIDVTNITFPFKPGDYVVHANHGIALFSAIVRQEVAGRERDYFLLEYADGDKLYVPLEQVDRLTRYVGPDGSSPRLTRLNTADWSRAKGKASKSAKKLAFDLVDLYTRRSVVTGYAFSPDTAAQTDMEANFTYELTRDQEAALIDIKCDMESDKPMDRLLCGDVGFGKTEVALRAAFKCCMDEKQVIVLCPTTILAQQHFDTFHDRFAPFDLKVEVLSRFVTPANQKKILTAFSEGDVNVLIGTHRLLSADVCPKSLGLVIVDEEQRFGVQAKEQLKNMREQIDVLTLSATPIPRTMQMAMSGVRDMSMILTPPVGRKPVNVYVGEYDPDVVSAAIRYELAREGQVYYVSNRVHTMEDAVERVREAAPEARVAFAHGKMSARQVEDVMIAFQLHEIDVLVATTIIESGIDNPLTNTLIIEDSQRLGLAQLYQLKGRVGRGREQAYAFFMFPADQPLTPEATERLTALGEFQELGSGMRIAMKDLEIRGAGSLMGAEQHGNLSGVGFDLFTQMLGQAVAEARGEVAEGDEPSDVTINLPCDFFLAEEFIPEVDKRVLAYRKLAAVSDLKAVDELQKELEDTYGGMPLAARNLFDRARVRIRAERLDLTSIALTQGKLVYSGIEVPAELSRRFRAERAFYFPKTKQLKYPLKKSEEEVMPQALAILARVGGDDEDE